MENADTIIIPFSILHYPLLSSCIQHVFNKDTVAGGGVVYKDMGKVMIPTRFDGLSNTESVE